MRFARFGRGIKKIFRKLDKYIFRVYITNMFNKIFQASQEISRKETFAIWAGRQTVESKSVYAALVQFCTRNGIRVVVNADASCGVSMGSLIVLPSMDVHVLAHEIAHSLLHNKTMRDAAKVNASVKSAMEVEAELTAHAICQEFGIDTFEVSAAYIRNWNVTRKMIDNCEDRILRTVNQVKLSCGI